MGRRIEFEIGVMGREGDERGEEERKTKRKCCFGGANEERSRSEGPGNSRFREMTNGGLGSRISRGTTREEMWGGIYLECKVH